MGGGGERLKVVIRAATHNDNERIDPNETEKDRKSMSVFGATGGLLMRMVSAVDRVSRDWKSRMPRFALKYTYFCTKRFFT